MNSLYPLKFKPIFKDKIWGGQKIKTSLKLDYGDLPNCGEAWMMSGVEGNPTLVDNGFLAGNELNEIVEIYMGELVGDKVFNQFGNEFPLLIKFIDSNDWLSIQVHPDDELARKRNIGYGKTEMWYMLDATEDAELIAGFNKKTDKNEYLKHLENKTLKEVLNFEKVEKGDVFYIPAGRVHALGPGCLLAEIQQTSDTTYRIYDWDRIDATGMFRELHTEEALDAIDFEYHEKYKTEYNKTLNETNELVDSQYFTTRILHLDKPVLKNYAALDSFVIYIATEGDLEIKWDGGSIGLHKGETLLVPASIDNIAIKPARKSTLLEIFIS
ncbi:MAG: mannose-6-phosphate isomerase [Marinilabiliales bacterium]|nr:MAG: mannose-6-phosphate isomerase [Marinilabiliales bacterium]